MRVFIVCSILISCSLVISCTGWAYKVPTANMLPTIQVGDRCLVNKFDNSPIERFDIVVFNAPDEIQEINGGAERTQSYFKSDWITK